MKPSLPLLLCLLLSPLPARAAGLGELSMLSRIGEPLRAEITLLASGDEKLAAPCFSLERIGNAELPVITKARIQLLRQGKRHYLSLTTTTPLHEPLATLRLRAGCGAELVRDYALMPLPPDSRIEHAALAPSDSQPSREPRPTTRRESVQPQKPASQLARSPAKAPPARGDRLLLSTSLSFAEPLPPALSDETEARLLRMETSLARLNESLQKLDGALALRQEAQTLRQELQIAQAIQEAPAAGPLAARETAIWRQWLELIFGTLLGGVLSAVGLQWLSQRVRPGYRDR